MRKAIGWLEVASMFLVIALVAFFHRLEGSPPPVEEATRAASSSAAYSAIPIDPVEAAWEDGWSKAEADLASPTPWDPKFTVRVATAFYNDPPARSDKMTDSEARDAGYDKRLQQWVRKKYKRLPAGEIGQWAVDASRPWEVFAREASRVVTLTSEHSSFARPDGLGVSLRGNGTLEVPGHFGRPAALEGTFKKPRCVFVVPWLFVTEDGVYAVYDVHDGRLIHRVHAQMVE